MKVRVTFTQCFIASQLEGAGQQDRLVATIRGFFFHNDQLHYFESEITQPEGFDYANPEQFPLVVSQPRFTTWNGRFKHESFREAAECYYRSSKGSGVHVENSTNVRVINTNIQGGRYDADIEVADKGNAW